MKSLLKLHITVLQDVGRQCSIDIARDVITVTNRCEDEGDSYLTITLPLFAKALEKGLEQGYWPERSDLPIWKYHRGLPAFLRGFLLRIFDENGIIRPDPDALCIRSIRQFCLLSQKIRRECTPDRVRAAFDGFVRTDEQLMFLPSRLEKGMLSDFVRASHKLFGDIFADCDRLIAEYGLIPRHGPGSVAEKFSPREKRDWASWPERLNSVFPAWRYTQNTGYISPMPVTPDNEIPVRVITVPKTQSKPRIISIEPTAMQYAQQGLKRELYERIGRGPLSKVLGFQDQTRNQEMARVASITGEYATLDLSEASDRVHWFLVYKMLERYPHLWDFVHASRSSRADVSGYGVIPLQKFASMGSALTFPFEAIVFTTLAALGLRESRMIHSISPRRLVGRMSVYGDDIIVPIDSVDSVIRWLSHFGAKVNVHKSFWIGKFRESCGAEFYDGDDVSVVRLNSELPSSQSDAADLASYISFRNRLFRAGYWDTVKEIDNGLESIIDLPYVYVDSADQAGFLHLETFNKYKVVPKKTRYNPNLQRLEIKVPYSVAQSRSYVIDGEPGLLEWFHASLTRGDLVDPFVSKERAASFNIQRRWVPTYVLGGMPE